MKSILLTFALALTPAPVFAQAAEPGPYLRRIYAGLGAVTIFEGLIKKRDWPKACFVAQHMVALELEGTNAAQLERATQLRNYACNQ